MRMTQFQTKSASDVVNEYKEEELQTIFREYGEIKNSRCAAKVIVAERELTPIKTTTQLGEIVEKCFPPTKRNKYLAMVFQALRIEVKLDRDGRPPEELLTPKWRNDCKNRMKAGTGISYHSLEERPVKNFIRTGNIEGRLEKDFYGNPITIFKSVNSRPIVSDEAEIDSNSRARSAKLRIAEKQ